MAPALQQPKPCGRWVARRPGDVCSATIGAETARHPGDVCSAPTEAERRPWTHGRLLYYDRSLAEDGLQDVQGTSVLQRPGRSGDRVRSGGPHATSRPSRRRDLEPWAPAPQQPKPCGRWGARHPGDVCSAPTEAERRPWTHGDKVRFRF